MKRYIAHMKEIVCKILFEDVSFTTAANNKFIDSVSAVDLEDMPKHWLDTYFNHRFWL